jgi:hypothetical protein
MDERRFRQRERRSISSEPRSSEDKVQYLLDAEERILRSIALRVPVREILNGICTALDSQIGNMVSRISLPESDLANASDNARNADLFGLHIFFAGGIFDEFGKGLASLEMYCCIARNPTPFELQCIERAACLAAVALECDVEPKDQANHHMSKKKQVRNNAPESPASVN